MDRLLGKMLPNSAAHSNPSSGQPTQSICPSHALLASWHLLHLGACGAQRAQLAQEGLHPAPSTQPQWQQNWQLSQLRASTVPSTGCAGGSPGQGAHPRQMLRTGKAQPSPCESPCSSTQTLLNFVLLQSWTCPVILERVSEEMLYLGILCLYKEHFKKTSRLHLPYGSQWSFHQFNLYWYLLLCLQT